MDRTELAERFRAAYQLAFDDDNFEPLRKCIAELEPVAQQHADRWVPLADGEAPKDTRGQWWICTVDLDDGEPPMTWPVFGQNGKWYYGDGEEEYGGTVIAYLPNWPAPYAPEDTKDGQ